MLRSCDFPTQGTPLHASWIRTNPYLRVHNITFVFVMPFGRKLEDLLSQGRSKLEERLGGNHSSPSQQNSNYPGNTYPQQQQQPNNALFYLLYTRYSSNVTSNRIQPAPPCSSTSTPPYAIEDKKPNREALRRYKTAVYADDKITIPVTFSKSLSSSPWPPTCNHYGRH